MESSQKILTFLDPDLYGSTAGEEIDTHYICVICTGVVIDPVECTGCECLYCRGCLSSLEMECPKKCGRSEYTKVNRFVMNLLNKLKFRCQYTNCKEVIDYEHYPIHYNECPEGKAQECKDPECQYKIKSLTNQVIQLKAHIHEIETYKDRNLQIKENLISDLKQQLKQAKNGGNESIVNQDPAKQHQQRLSSSIYEKANTILCPGSHPLRQKHQNPLGNEISCDICLKGNLLAMPYFFRCESNCNYDICAFCYYLLLTDQNMLVNQIKQMAEQNKDNNIYGATNDLKRNLKDFSKDLKHSFGSLWKKK